ncbi:MAG: DUF2029 domain-containing protein [Alphaproteobacteria bacterium]|nr:DUF2029 domain-containing protein [Alphaproteobacteria bacterium]
MSDPRWPALLDRERLTVYPRIFAALYLLIGGGWLLSGPGLLDRGGKPLGGDFITFYAASELVLSGAPDAVFDLERLHAVEQAVIGVPIDRFAWHYPPTALLLVAPLAALPFVAALGIVTLVSLAIYVATLRGVDKGPLLLGLALAFPGLFQNLIHGQNGCLSLALLGGGLLLLERRPGVAGVLLGLLSMKPHLTPMVGLALLAGRQWRALGAMAATALGLAGVSAAALGPAPWQAFVDNLPFAQAVLYEGGVAWEKMPTASAAALLLGAPPVAAKAAQAVVTLGAAGAVAWLWARPCPHDLRAAGLTLAVLLATPFAFEYDLAILAFPLALLGVAGARAGWQRGDVAALIAGYALPFLAPALAGLTRLQVGPLVLAALLACALRRAR